MGAKGRFFQRYLARSHTANAERDSARGTRAMYAKIFPGTTVMEKYIIRFPLAPTGTDYGADANEAVWVDIPIILPWDVVESYSRAGKLDKWVRGLEYEQYNSAFWSNAMRMGWGRAHCTVSPQRQKHARRAEGPWRFCAFLLF